MEPRLSIVTLGVADLERADHFYAEGLGWKRSATKSENIRFFPLGGVVLALYPRDKLAEDACLPHTAVTPFGGITLAHNVRTQDEVASVLRLAERAGAKILKPAQDVFWGGHSGYFADLDGYPWEVCYNPYFPLDAAGQLHLPE